jgi:hypothetical protein
MTAGSGALRGRIPVCGSRPEIAVGAAPPGEQIEC